MFARVKKSGQYHYLQIVENNKVKGQSSSGSLPRSAAWIICRQRGAWRP